MSEKSNTAENRTRDSISGIDRAKLDQSGRVQQYGSAYLAHIVTPGTVLTVLSVG